MQKNLLFQAGREDECRLSANLGLMLRKKFDEAGMSIKEQLKTKIQLN